MDIVYNIYYSLSEDGPWTLANNTPITHTSEVMEYTITGLTTNALHYITIIGGYEQDGEFVSLMSQPVGPVDIGATSVGSSVTPNIEVLTYSPDTLGDDTLTHTFEVGILF